MLKEQEIKELGYILADDFDSETLYESDIQYEECCDSIGENIYDG